MSFLEDLKNESNLTLTENGAVALSSTMNACLDAFGSLGAMRNSSEEQILETFVKAFLEDRATAMKILFYMRDIRGGQGMRRVFRTIVVYLANNYPEFIINNLKNFAEYGRWDDLLCLLDTDVKEQVLVFIKNQFIEDLASWYNGDSVSLLAKWLPSENASSKTTKRYAKIIREYLQWGPKSYRTTLSKLRSYLNVVEVKMSANEWGKIDYSGVPGKASLLYSNAFAEHDADRYIDFLSTTDKLNAKALFPVDIIEKAFTVQHSRCSKKDRLLLDKMWNSLPNYLEGTEETGICMVDTSGSMYGKPLAVALSLGIYCADKCRGPFKDHFITFSQKPELVHLTGNDIVEKVTSIGTINTWNTDFEAALDLILKTAVNNNTPQEDLPKKLYVISDMQFDEARGSITPGWVRGDNFRGEEPFMETMRKKYEAHGYSLPSIVYWNVRASSCGIFQQKFDGEDCAMVSGYSPSLFKSIIEGTTYEEVISEDGKSVGVREKIDPMTVMMTTLNNPRYDAVWVG